MDREGLEAPSLVVSGPAPPRLLRFRWLRMTVIALAGGLFVLLLGAGRLGWTPWVPPRVLSGIANNQAAFKAGFFVLAIGAAVAAEVWSAAVRRRAGVAEVFADRIVVGKPETSFDEATTTAVAWTELAGFRDGAAEFVQLVLVDGTAGVRLTIPTPTEAEREPVLRALVERGIPRLDA